MVAAENKVQRYDSYKDSGIEWLGEIPKHWSVKKLKFIGHVYAGISGKKGDDFSKEYAKGIKSFIPFTNICNNIIIDENQYQFVKIDEKENQNRVLKNDILFLMSSETLDDIAKCSIYLGDDKELYLNSFCKGFRIKKTNIYPEYINYLLSSKVYRNYFALVGRGFTRINLKQDFINNATVTLPPLLEQTKIAQFLDDKTTKIDDAIAIKQQQIKVLKERKQILIHKAVTRGLDDSVKLKDSGVEWIGEIPEHWELLPGFMVYKENKTKNDGMKEDVVLSLSYGNIVIKPKEKLVGLVPESFETYQIVKPGDIIIRCMDLQNDKTSLRTGIAVNDGIITSAYLNLNIINNNVSAYVYNFLHALDTTKVLYKFGTGLRQNLSFGDFKHLRIPIPPIHEQEGIVIYIENITQKIERAIGLKQQEIAKLKEYKRSLINGVVTGKVRVC